MTTLHLRRFPCLKILTMCLLIVVVSACSTYSDRVTPVPLPAAHSEHVDFMGAKLVAHPYIDEERAQQVFGFNIREAGLLPVRFVVDNQSASEVRINPGQTFLIDTEEQAWPLLTTEQAYRRIKRDVELGEVFKGAARPSVLLGTAGAVVGFAIGMIAGENIGSAAGKGAIAGASLGALLGGGNRYERLDGEIQRDLRRRALKIQRVRPGELAYGYLFFPGKNEATSARMLRLSLKIANKSHVVNLPFLK